MASSETNPTTVMVTGATGFIASWLVHDLLAQGFHVRATVRNMNKKEKYQHLLEIADKQPGVLEIVEADLLKPDSFTLGMQHCEIVFHTASPFLVSGIKDAQKQLVDPALEGTRNVLQSVNQTASVKRVVLTSSVVSLFTDGAELKEAGKEAFTEEMWNETASLTYQPYAYSKTLAEREAWKMAEAQDRWKLVVINPAFVLGPSLTPRTDSTSISFILNILKGQLRAGAPGLYFGVVDVRDVSQAHIQAGILPGASGRHIAAASTHSMLEINNMIKAKYGQRFPLAKTQLPKFMLYLLGPALGFNWRYVKRNVNVPIAYDNSYTQQDLQMTFRPVSETLIDQTEQMIAMGLVKG